MRSVKGVAVLLSVLAFGMCVSRMAKAQSVAAVMVAKEIKGEREVADKVGGVELTLARAAVAECGWKKTDCHAATWHVMRRRQAKFSHRWEDLGAMFHAYCALFRGKSKGRKQWLRSLSGRAEPVGWPAASSWAKHTPLWIAVRNRAVLFLRGRVKDPCEGHPDHFGAGLDLLRFSPRKWRYASCGDTGAQRFLVLR